MNAGDKYLMERGPFKGETLTIKSTYHSHDEGLQIVLMNSEGVDVCRCHAADLANCGSLVADSVQSVRESAAKFNDNIAKGMRVIDSRSGVEGTIELVHGVEFLVQWDNGMTGSFRSWFDAARAGVEWKPRVSLVQVVAQWYDNGKRVDAVRLCSDPADDGTIFVLPLGYNPQGRGVTVNFAELRDFVRNGQPVNIFGKAG
jgi:hypothetical protein